MIDYSSRHSCGVGHLFDRTMIKEGYPIQHKRPALPVVTTIVITAIILKRNYFSLRECITALQLATRSAFKLHSSRRMQNSKYGVLNTEYNINYYSTSQSNNIPNSLIPPP